MPGTPAANDATCNGIDEDCSGQKDEDYVATATSCGVGACVRSGSLACVNGSTSDTCAPGTPAANDATCDGIDDDCSGQKDEDYVPVSSSCGYGVCASTGTVTCVSGSTSDSCVPGTAGTSVDGPAVNGLDDDCDNSVDEDACTAAPQTFSTTALQTITVPAHCGTMTVQLWGAGGASGNANAGFWAGVVAGAGGPGGFAQRTFTVTSTNVITLRVGQSGQGCGAAGANVNATYSGGAGATGAGGNGTAGKTEPKLGGTGANPSSGGTGGNGFFGGGGGAAGSTPGFAPFGPGGGGGAASVLFVDSTRLVAGGGGGGGGAGTTIATNGVSAGNGGSGCSGNGALGGCPGRRRRRRRQVRWHDEPEGYRHEPIPPGWRDLASGRSPGCRHRRGRRHHRRLFGRRQRVRQDHVGPLTAHMPRPLKRRTLAQLLLVCALVASAAARARAAGRRCRPRARHCGIRPARPREHRAAGLGSGAAIERVGRLRLYGVAATGERRAPSRERHRRRRHRAAALARVRAARGWPLRSAS